MENNISKNEFGIAVLIAGGFAVAVGVTCGVWWGVLAFGLLLPRV